MAKTTEPVAAGLQIRKLADTSSGERIIRYDPDTGQRKLVNPHTPGDAHEPWPLAGVQFEGDPPAAATVPDKLVAQWITEGWCELVSQRVVHRPAGTLDNPYGRPAEMGAPAHTFVHADAIVFHMVDGDFTYRITHQPDKYADGEGHDDETTVDDDIYAAGDTRVDHFYRIELED